VKRSFGEGVPKWSLGTSRKKPSVGQSWTELLLDLRQRGLTLAPLLDGAQDRQRAQQAPKSVQLRAKGELHEIWMVETRAQAEKVFDAFLAKYQAKYEDACQCGCRTSKVPAPVMILRPACNRCGRPGDGPGRRDAHHAGVQTAGPLPRSLLSTTADQLIQHGPTICLVVETFAEVGYFMVQHWIRGAKSYSRSWRILPALVGRLMKRTSKSPAGYAAFFLSARTHPLRIPLPDPSTGLRRYIWLPLELNAGWPGSFNRP
jgi:hypothetical protein